MGGDSQDPGRSLLRHPLTYILGAVIAGVSASGIGWIFDQADTVQARICDGPLQVLELELERKHDHELYRTQLSHTTETGQLLREECDRELEDQSRNLQKSFTYAITASVNQCNQRLEDALSGCLSMDPGQAVAPTPGGSVRHPLGVSGPIP